jgi:D-xylose transport system substrate-binding protein
VYKPITLEAQGAVAAALFLRAGQTPPASLVNSTTRDTTANADIQSVYLTPLWVTSQNLEATVVKDGFRTAATICIPAIASACTAAGIS